MRLLSITLFLTSCLLMFCGTWGALNHFSRNHIGSACVMLAMLIVGAFLLWTSILNMRDEQ